MYTFTFGEQCQVRAIAKKKKNREPWQNYARFVSSRWQREEIMPKQGLFIGTRTVADCDFRAQGYQEDYDEEITVLKYHRVYLVVFSTRENPVYVFPEDCMP